MRNWAIVFHSGCTILQSYQQCTMVLISLQPQYHVILLFFLTIDILKDMKCYLIMILIFTLLMISDVDHLLMCLFVYLHIVFGEKFFESLAHFWTGFLSYCWVWRILYIFWIIIPFQICDLQIFCPILCCLCPLNLEMIVNFWAPTLHLWV